jgi:hypothetical protein
MTSLPFHGTRRSASSESRKSAIRSSLSTTEETTLVGILPLYFATAIAQGKRDQCHEVRLSDVFRKGF